MKRFLIFMYALMACLMMQAVEGETHDVPMTTLKNQAAQTVEVTFPP